MKRWEYQVETDAAKLNEWGKAGWELVSVVVHEQQTLHYMKRAQLPLRDRITLEQRERALEGSEQS